MDTIKYPGWWDTNPEDFPCQWCGFAVCICDTEENEEDENE